MYGLSTFPRIHLVWPLTLELHAKPVITRDQVCEQRFCKVLNITDRTIKH